MKTQNVFQLLLISFLILSCSSSANYSEEFKSETSGKYLFNADDLMIISYEGNDLYLHWRGVKTKPVTTDTNEFFVPDLYKKLRFVKHPETQKRYISAISEENPDSLSYDYLKVADDYKTPSQYIKDKDFENALEGLLAIKAQDSLSDFINQYKFNRIGYRYLRDDNYKDAIGIFTMNTKLHPNSGNVYDSLADAYLQSGDSIKAYDNYKKALSINQDNRRARKYINAYEGK
ncbi:MAG: tetratricopeptide repeat protein [Winogradskyella sp.]|uniref:tetratricopeptide repeat protein n=1 Tax=Winogradskyella sp. TaxID=1883156 RepID=UPI000F41286B|nr:tetratricopeptide repeat protein [Winogradskyella sp.]RNC86914.1 MAG: tetratricopeptide repeat protein [Winogradskyella sp.]